MTDMLYIVPAHRRGLQPIFQFKTLEGDFCEGSCVCAVLGRGALVDDLTGPHDGKHLYEVEIFMKIGMTPTPDAFHFTGSSGNT